MDVDVIYNEDCVTGMQKYIPDNSIDLIVTSPPYNLGIEYDSYNDTRPWNEYYDWCRTWLTEIYRVLKPDGRFCLNHYLSCGTAEERSAPLMNLNYICCYELGFKHHGLGVWDDRTITKRTAWGSWLSASAPYCNSPFEGILILFKNRWKKDKLGISDISGKEFMESCSGIWKIHPEQDGGTEANFPLALPMWCVRLLSFQGDIVLDPFSGSGTTALAAKLTGRKYIGYEISEKYYKISKKRLEQSPLELPSG